VPSGPTYLSFGGRVCLTSLPLHPFPDVWRTVQNRDVRRLTLVQEANAINIHEIDLLQIQRYVWSPTINLRFQLPKVLGSKLAAKANPRFPSTKSPFDLQCHGPSPEPRFRRCNTYAVPNCL
jgi:hypothetical protein